MLKNKRRQRELQIKEKAKWDHKIFKVYEAEPDSENAFMDLNSERTSHVFIDELPEVFDELNYFGWNFNFGFTLDNNSFYLLYKKPLASKDSNK